MPVEGGTKAGRWLLASEEIGVTIRAPLEARMVTVDYGLQVSDHGGFADGEMSAVPQASQARRVSLTAEFHADHAADDIAEVAGRLETLRTKDNRLGRVPLVSFVFGDVSIDNGYLSQLNIQWMHGIFDSDPPHHRAFIATLQVARTRKRALEKTTKLERNTRHIRLGDGESFELVALREYGDPNLGEALRRINTGIVVDGEQAGDLVMVPDKDNSSIREFSLEPVSPALLGDVAEVLQAMSAERYGRYGPGLVALEEDLGLL